MRRARILIGGEIGPNYNTTEYPSHVREHDPVTCSTHTAKQLTGQLTPGSSKTTYVEERTACQITQAYNNLHNSHAPLKTTARPLELGQLYNDRATSQTAGGNSALCTVAFTAWPTFAYRSLNQTILDHLSRTGPGTSRIIYSLSVPRSYQTHQRLTSQ